MGFLGTPTGALKLFGRRLSRYSGFSVLGGVFPPLISSAIQWLYRIKDDGLTLEDKLDPLVVSPEPQIVDRAVVAFDGVNGKATLSAPLNYGANDFEVSIEVLLTGTQLGAVQFLINALDGNDDGIRISTTPAIAFCSLNALDVIFPYTIDGDFHTITLKRVGNVFEVFEDGVSKGTQDCTGEVVDVSKVPVSGHRIECTIANFYASGLYDLHFEETAGLTVYGSMGNGNNGTLSGGVTWGVADGVPSPNALYGFTRDGDVLVPADQSNTGYDVLGNLLTNPGGYVCNGSEVGNLQQDLDETVFGGANLYGNGTDSWYLVLAGDWDTHINGAENVWVQYKRVGPNNVCVVKEVFALPVGLGMTLAEYRQMKRWVEKYTDDCGAGMKVPMMANGVYILANGKVVFTDPPQ